MMTNREDQEAWDAIADFWHDRMGEGNDFVDVLIWPVVRRLLPPLKGLRVLDIGCGNGLYEEHSQSSESAATPTIRLEAYRTPSRSYDMAMRQQPVKTLFFHRSISDLLRPAFSAGLVLDALEEPSFPAGHESGRPNSWGGRFHEFPPVLAGRLRNNETE